MLTLLVGVVIGLVLGLTGAGGSVLAVPLLVFGLGHSTTEAVGISLGTVCAAALFGSIQRLGLKQIAWTPAMIFAASGLALAPLGVYLSKYIPEPIHIGSFGILMLLIASKMLWQSLKTPEQSLGVRAERRTREAEPNTPYCQTNTIGKIQLKGACVVLLMLGGITTGLLSGIYGVGGGFLIVPALVFLTGISMRSAIATSLVVISAISLSGFLAFILQPNAHQTLPVVAVSITIFGALVGMLIGTILSKRIAGPRLQQIFVGAITVVSIFTIMNVRNLS